MVEVAFNLDANSVLITVVGIGIVTFTWLQARINKRRTKEHEEQEKKNKEQMELNKMLVENIDYIKENYTKEKTKNGTK